MIFVIVHLILHLVWAFITSGVVLGRATRRWNFLWLYSTAAVLSYGAVVAGVFTVEIIEAKVFNSQKILDLMPCIVSSLVILTLSVLPCIV